MTKPRVTATLAAMLLGVAGYDLTSRPRSIVAGRKQVRRVPEHKRARFAARIEKIKARNERTERRRAASKAKAAEDASDD